MAMQWYAVTTYSNYENKVRSAIVERAKAEGLEDHIGRILIPQEEVADIVRGKRRISKRSYFPGYLFVEMVMNEVTWELVRNTPKVTNFVGGRKPTPVPQPQIDAILAQMEEGAAKPAPRIIFDEGDNVRVVDGPFTNFTGVVEEVRPEKQKLRVLVSIFGRATPVELEYHQVEKT
jgi:transcriptional antiterminator NusG